MIPLLDRILGYYTVTVEGVRLADAANAMLNAGLSLRMTSDGRVHVPARLLRPLRTALGDIAYTVSPLRGGMGFLCRHGRCYGIAAALVLLLLCLFISSRVVWDVRIEGEDLTDALRVEEELRACGLFSGARWREVDFGKTETELLSVSDTVGWVSIYRRGHVAYVTVVEKTVHERPSPPVGYASVVSAYDAVVDEVLVSRGYATVKKGDTVRILPGETIPVDGEIISGDTSVDQSVMTGESLPVDKTVGDSVFSGTVNRFGAVDVRASRVGSDSSISKLIRMVKEAEEKKAPMQRSADKWASFLVPVALVIAIAAYIITKDPVRAVTVLVVFCPCALVLATPTAIMAAIGQATKKGIIIKSGEALENMGKAQAIAFDKTGTLTYGKPDVSDVFVCGNMSERELVSLCAAAEVRSEHPLAKAITDYAQKNDIAFSQPVDFSMCAGKGVAVTTERGKVLCGNERYIVESGVDIDENALEALEKFHADGKASIVVACDGECMGIIALSDKMKPEVPEMTKRLVEMGIIPVLLTGDNVRAAEFMANKTGIGSVYAELLPGDKVEAVQKLGERGGAVCMVGDGINDAPALKCADVGIAMGAMGSDIAVEAADIAIMSDDISKVTYIRRLSLETLKTIRFSISLSLFINFAAIILSFFGIIGPTAGALIHNAGSCFVVLIAAMLYDKKIDG